MKAKLSKAGKKFMEENPNFYPHHTPVCKAEDVEGSAPFEVGDIVVAVQQDNLGCLVLGRRYQIDECKFDEDVQLWTVRVSRESDIEETKLFFSAKCFLDVDSVFFDRD